MSRRRRLSLITSADEPVSGLLWCRLHPFVPALFRVGIVHATGRPSELMILCEACTNSVLNDEHVIARPL